MTSRFVLPYADVGSGIKPSSGAKLFFFETGTSTPKDTYTDLDATTPNTNPVIADSKGVFTDIFIVGKYKVVLQDKNGSQIWEADPVDEYLNSNGIGDAIGGFVTYDFNTVVNAQNGQAIGGVTVTLEAGDVIRIKERGSALFDVVAGSAGANGFEEIAHATLDLKFVLRVNDTANILHFLGAGDGTDQTTGVQAWVDYQEANNIPGEGWDQEYLVNLVTKTLTGDFRWIGNVTFKATGSNRLEMFRFFNVQGNFDIGEITIDGDDKVARPFEIRNVDASVRS